MIDRPTAFSHPWTIIQLFGSCSRGSSQSHSFSPYLPLSTSTRHPRLHLDFWPCLTGCLLQHPAETARWPADGTDLTWSTFFPRRTKPFFLLTDPPCRVPQLPRSWTLVCVWGGRGIGWVVGDLSSAFVVCSREENGVRVDPATRGACKLVGAAAKELERGGGVGGSWWRG